VKHRMTRRGREAALLMWICIALFSARVIGQFEVLVAAPAWLPDMAAWYSGLLPYYLLLPVQIALLMIMAVVAWSRRVRTGRFALANPRVARVLRGFALVYVFAMALRLGYNVMTNGADYWREGAIPVAFHWVLALFMLVSARPAESVPGLLRIPAEDQQQDDEADDVPHGDVPALTQPLAYGLGFGEQVRYRDAG
jgi:hypothetical protein